MGRDDLHQDPASKEYKPTDYVFGYVTGAQVKSVKTAWKNTVLRARTT